MGSNCSVVTSIEILRPGDHLAYKTGLFRYQHAIVVSVNSQKELTIVRFRDAVGSHSAASNPRIHTHVREEELDASEYIRRQQLYRYNYRFYDCFLPGAVVERARRGALGYNAQTFCYWCKTGRKISPRACLGLTFVGAVFAVWLAIVWAVYRRCRCPPDDN